MEQPNERDWVRRARTGDRVGFTELVKCYWDRIRRWLFGLTHHAHLAEDLAQETFVKAWVGLAGLEKDEHFRAWLFRIARNLALDSEKRPRVVIDLRAPDEMPGKCEEPLAALVQDETRQRLREECERLPEPYRAAYLLWTQEEMPYAEIAQALAVSEVTARWRVCKARQALLARLQAD